MKTPADIEIVFFRTPAAFHNARWMAKAIYSINVFLFHQHFSLTVNVKFSLKELALCVSLGYVRFWHQAPLPIQAPLNDKKLTKYQNIAVAQAVSTTFRRQLWYFFEILVGLSFFYERVRG